MSLGGEVIEDCSYIAGSCNCTACLGNVSVAEKRPGAAALDIDN